MALITPSFDPARSAFVAWKAETQDYTPSADGDTPAALAAIPSSPTVVGYTDAPERNKRFNNGIGYGTGTPFGLYNIRGRVEPDVRIVIRLGSFNFLLQCLVNETTFRMPKIALFVGVQGKYTEVYRNCQCGDLQLQFAPGQGGRVAN